MIELIDLQAQQKLIGAALQKNIQAVLSHGKYILGPEVSELEKKLAQYVGVPHAIACASGTDALQLALMALEVGPGDAVFVPSFTFVASVETIVILGATPIFVDVDPQTINLDPKHLQMLVTLVRKSKKLKPKAIIAVDLFGQLADYNAINDIAKKENLFVIEDAAQSFGASQNGRRSCSFGIIACTSFFPAKPLGCYGDGGMMFTNDESLDKKLRSLRNHGQGQDKYDNIRVGLNSRLDTMQAAILLAKLEVFPDEIQKREGIANNYTKKLSPIAITPYIVPGNKSAWAQYCIQVSRRDELIDFLQKNQIGSAIYYPKPLHLQSAYKHFSVWSALPVSEEITKNILAIPMHPYLIDENIDKICTVIREFYKK